MFYPSRHYIFPPLRVSIDKFTSHVHARRPQESVARHREGGYRNRIPFSRLRQTGRGRKLLVPFLCPPARRGLDHKMSQSVSDDIDLKSARRVLRSNQVESFEDAMLYRQTRKPHLEPS